VLRTGSDLGFCHWFRFRVWVKFRFRARVSVINNIMF
jgi:hypothetical protein